MNSMILSGLAVGVLFGFLLQRGYLCQLTGFTYAFISKDFRIIKTTIWAVLTAMIGFHLMANFGLISLNPDPLFLGANIVGGIIFGLGMFLAGACSLGIMFKIGMGLIGYFISLLGAMIAFILSEGFLKPYIATLQEATAITINGLNPTLDSLFKINSWIVIIILALVFILFLLYLKEKSQNIPEKKDLSFKNFFKAKWSPALVGVLFGITQMVAFLTAAASGRNYPVGIIKEDVPIFKSFLLSGDFGVFNWMYAAMPGIILGSAFSALLSGEFRWRLPKIKQVPKLLIGGFLIGIGVAVAAGCGNAYIFSGIPQLSLGSIVTVATIFLTIYLISYFKFIRKIWL